MLAKQHRLSSTYEFNKVRRFGKRVSTSLFDLFYLDVIKYEGPTRFGIVVTNRYSKKAPVRSRVKRVFREVLRLNLDKIKDGYWIVMHPKKTAQEKRYEDVNTEFTKILQKTPFTR